MFVRDVLMGKFLDDNARVEAQLFDCGIDIGVFSYDRIVCKLKLN